MGTSESINSVQPKPVQTPVQTPAKPAQVNSAQTQANPVQTPAKAVQSSPSATAQSLSYSIASSKAAVDYSTAKSDMQKMDNKGVQEKFGVPKTELADAIKQLDRQVDGKQVEQAVQSEMTWDASSGTRNNTKTKLIITNKDENLSGLDSDQRKAEMSTRANIALNVYSLLKKNDQGQVKSITVKASYGDPKRYNVVIEPPDSPNKTKPEPVVIPNINPEKLKELPAKMGIDTPSAQKSGSVSSGSQTGIDITPSGEAVRQSVLPKAQEVPDAPETPETKRVREAFAHGVHKRGCELKNFRRLLNSNKFIAEVCRNRGKNATPASAEPPTLTATVEMNNPTTSQAQEKGETVAATLVALDDKCKAKGDPLKSATMTLSESGKGTLSTQTASGAKIVSPVNNLVAPQNAQKIISNTLDPLFEVISKLREAGIKLNSTCITANENGMYTVTGIDDYGQEIAMEGYLEEGYGYEDSGYESGYQPGFRIGKYSDLLTGNSLDFQRIIYDAWQQFYDKRAALEKQSKEDEKINEKKAEEKRQDEKVAQKAIDKKIQAAFLLALKAKKEMGTKIMLDPREFQELALKIIDEEAKTRKMRG
ncbi:MAG: hypothetical protein WC527_06110 [Candidatus Margulisiibacteriota bacterium]